MNILFKNGKVATLNSNNDLFQAIGIKGNKIDFLGSLLESKKIEKDYDQVIDLEGKTMLPGFNDSHLHVLGYGLSKNMLILSSCKSVDDIIKISKNYINVKMLKPGKFLLGRGWNQDNLVEKRFPTKEDLDKISKELPIIFRRTCGHVAVCNSVAISMIDPSLLDNENIEAEVGLFKEDALDILNSLVEVPSIEEIKEAIILAGEEMLTYGITSAQTDDFCVLAEKDYGKVLTAYDELIKENKLPIRIYEQCLIPKLETLQKFIRDGNNTGFGNEFFKIGPLKLLLDGALGSKTAKIRNGYIDDPHNTGISVYTQPELDAMVAYAHEKNMQVAVHAIGDEAIYMVLDAIKKAQTTSAKDLRHGIVHCQITNMEIINRMADENILAYVQPIFLDYDMHIVADRVGADKAKETYAFKTMYDKGIKISGGSDAPVVHFNIFENLYSAISRKDLNGYPENGWLPEEKLSVDEALKLFTIEGAYASFEEDIKGSLEVGKLADLVVLKEDIYSVAPDRIKDIEVSMTIIDGKIVYRGNSSAQ